LAALVDAARRRVRARPPVRIFVQSGTCGRALGAEALLVTLRTGVRARGFDAEVIDGACSGMCYAAPAVEVVAPGAPAFIVERLTASSVSGLLDLVASGEGDFVQAELSGVVRADNAWRGLPSVRDHPFWATQERRLLARSGALDPESLDDALVGGSYTALARALAGRPEDVIETVKASGVQGRGGAFFPTGLKWEACRKAAGEPKYVVLNGEEGEPGIFKDRHLMEGDPHMVLEGVLLAAYAAGATRAILYIHGEADVSAARMARAVAEARVVGLVGQRILASPFACDVEIRRGAGGFVLGEETALLESIEGRRAQPRTRPPFPVECGLFGQPTVINNVETLATIPGLVSQPDAFARLGTDNAPGTKVFGLAGPLARPGVVEVRNGVTLRHLLEVIAGGSVDGRDLVGALVGGPSGSIVPAALFDVPMAPRAEVSPGTGGVAAVPAGASIVEIVKTLVGFNARESCGKCTPCREGLPRLLAGIERLGIEPDAEARARTLAETIQLASLCGLGQAAPLALVRALRSFGAELGRRA
jgi:NADH-quinone oxidoreductase subunit F